MRIVVVDSDTITGKLLQAVLSEGGHEVVVVTNATQAFREIIEYETDAVLLDIDLPGMDGYALCKELRARRYNGPLIFVTERSELSDQLRAFDYGADDYVIEPYHPHVLVARVNSVARRCKQADYHALGTILKVGDAELSIGQLTFRIEGREPVLLTPTEMRMLECLMRNSHITISRSRLIERTWGYDFGGDSNRVDVYIRRLRRKIERDVKRPEYIHTVRRVGYVFRPPVQAKPVSRPLDATWIHETHAVVAENSVSSAAGAN